MSWGRAGCPAHTPWGCPGSRGLCRDNHPPAAPGKAQGLTWCYCTLPATMSLTANGANDNRSSSEQPCEQETLLARTARRAYRRRPEGGDLLRGRAADWNLALCPRLKMSSFYSMLALSSTMTCSELKSFLHQLTALRPYRFMYQLLANLNVASANLAKFWAMIGCFCPLQSLLIP